MFDVWLTDCQKPKGSVAQHAPADPNAGPGEAAPQPEEDPFAPRRRVRR